jgi:hypothetical protein
MSEKRRLEPVGGSLVQINIYNVLDEEGLPKVQAPRAGSSINISTPLANDSITVSGPSPLTVTGTATSSYDHFGATVTCKLGFFDDGATADQSVPNIPIALRPPPESNIGDWSYTFNGVLPSNLQQVEVTAFLVNNEVNVCPPDGPRLFWIQPPAGRAGTQGAPTRRRRRP